MKKKILDLQKLKECWEEANNPTWEKSSGASKFEFAHQMRCAFPMFLELIVHYDSEIRDLKEEREIIRKDVARLLELAKS